MRIAGTRGEVDTIVAHIAGTYPPATKERWQAVAKALAFAAGGVAVALLVRNDDPSAGWWLLLLVAGGFAAFGSWLLFDDTAIYSVGTDSFSRRNIVPLGNWTIPLADVRSVALDPSWKSLELTTTTDRKRQFVLRPAAQEKLENVPRPTEPQGFDVAGRSHGLLWYSSVILVLSIAAIVLDVSIDRDRLPWLLGVALGLASRLAIAGILLAPVGIIWELAQRGAERDPTAPVRYRRILYAVLVVVVVGLTATLFVLARKGLVTW